MKNQVQEIINNMTKANDMSKVLMAYNRFMASKQEDDKLKATYNMRADSFDETIKEKDKEIESMTEFLTSFEPIPSPFN
jgi:hypothetical protein